MYKFISSDSTPRKTMEFVCVNHFGVQKWAELVAPYLDNFGRANEKFESFLQDSYNEVAKIYTIMRYPCDNENSCYLYTVLSEGEVDNGFLYVDYYTAQAYCDSIINTTKLNTKKVLEDLKNNGFDKYIGAITQDEANGRTYLYYYNKEFDDVNYCMDIYNIKASGTCNAIMLCLTGKLYQRERKK